jgi:hypothetical protein
LWEIDWRLYPEASLVESRKKILDWLSPIDYVELQSDTFRKHQKGTGEWFLKSTPFIEWLEGKKKTLFCPGIPGTGKTMIASIVVNHLKTSFPDDKTGKAFLYCNYKRQENQEVDHLLASLLGQLAARQSMVPGPIHKLYDEHRRKGENSRLSQNDIREELHNIIKTYSRTFIVIDALDECETDHVRSELLSEVYKLQEGSDTRLMVTFRPSVVLERPSGVTELNIRAMMDLSTAVAIEKRALDSLSLWVTDVSGATGQTTGGPLPRRQFLLWADCTPITW